MTQIYRALVQVFRGCRGTCVGGGASPIYLNPWAGPRQEPGHVFLKIRRYQRCQ